MKNKKRTFVSDKIKNIVNDYYGIEIDKKVRRYNYVEARMIYYKLVRDNTHYSLTKIGETVNRHHSTVLASLLHFQDCVETDKELRTAYETLRDRLKEIIDGNHIFCPYCGDKKQLKIETDMNSDRVCKSRLCKSK